MVINKIIIDLFRRLAHHLFETASVPVMVVVPAGPDIIISQHDDRLNLEFVVVEIIDNIHIVFFFWTPTTQH